MDSPGASMLESDVTEESGEDRKSLRAETGTEPLAGWLSSAKKSAGSSGKSDGSDELMADETPGLGAAAGLARLSRVESKSPRSRSSWTFCLADGAVCASGGV